MSSNISITRICQHCGKDFEARTTVTKYCGDNCAKRAYKLRVKQEKIKASNEETLQIRNRPFEEIKLQECLTVKEASVLLRCARRTVYAMVDSGRLRAVNLSIRKTLIHKEEINRIFENPVFIVEPKSEKKADQVNWVFNNCYSIGEIEQNYDISGKTLYELLKRNNVEKIQQGKYVYVEKEVIHSLLGKFKKLNR